MNKVLSCVAVVGLLAASSSSVFARGLGPVGGQVSTHNPGSTYITNGKTDPTGPGASGYAPGHSTLFSPSNPPGVGGYAPGTVYAPGFLKNH